MTKLKLLTLPPSFEEDNNVSVLEARDNADMRLYISLHPRIKRSNVKAVVRRPRALLLAGH